MRRLVLSTSLLPIWLALFPACSVANSDHCGNREGDATCSQQADATPYCSICVADNNGCVAAVPEDRCLATTAAATSTTSPASSSTVDPGTTTVPGTTGDTTTAPTSNPTTEPTTTTTGLTDSGSTTLPDPSTTGDTSTTSGTTIDTVDTLGSTSTTTDTDTGGTTEVGPLCGNNMIDGDEVCDGTNNNGETCKTIVPGKWSGGMLKCNATCESFNDTMCCIGVGLACNILNDRCCGGLYCNLGTCTVK